MMEIESDKPSTLEEEDFRNALEKARKKIESTKPSTWKEEAFTNVHELRPSKDAKKIKYYNRINETIKENFREHQEKKDEILKIEKSGPIGSGPGFGRKWHQALGKCINRDSLSDDEKMAESVIKALKEKLQGIKFGQSNFPLFGYMTHKEKSDVSFWRGEADAIGWYEGKYVIVEWKVVDLQEFWRKDPRAYGDFLHQCIVYARLLMLHLDLQEWPYILIVPINNKNGEQIHPIMFKDFPEECKNEIKQYDWSKSMEEKPKIFELPKSLVSSGHEGVIDKNTKIHELFPKGTTVKDLLDALGFDILKLK